MIKIYDLLMSKRWDCIYTLDELIKNNEYECLIDLNYKRHKYDECFGQFILLFKCPHRNDNTYLQIGIREDGFVYVGDQFIRDYSEYKKVNDSFAIKFMLEYRNMILSVENFELSLRKIADRGTYINILYEDNYFKANSESFIIK